MQVKDHFQFALSELSASPSARLDTEIILSFVLNVQRSRLYSHPESELTAEQSAKFKHLISERKKSVPVAYLTGTKEFYGLDFTVNPDVLIPRPETELIIEEALKFATGKNNISILDLCTGSGCIAITLAHELKKKNISAKIIASDISEKALEVARANATNHAVSNNISFIHSDLFSSIPKQEFNLIVSNPPYVNAALNDLSPELKFEPALALYAQDRGLAVIQKISESVFDYLSLGSLLLIEIGSEQAEFSRTLFNRQKENLEILKDLSAKDRVIKISV